MRSSRTSVALALILATAPVSAMAAPPPRVEDMLSFSPIMSGVECDTPVDAAAIKACKVEPALNAQKKAIGWALRDGQGKYLRKFVLVNKSKDMDQWSYYQDGFEVYREVDLNNDRVPDECRWLNAGGTRVATVLKGKVASWKRISAEEATRVLVQGFVAGDLSLIESVMATPKELEAIGVPKAEVDEVATAAAKRVEQVRTLHPALTGWSKATVWNRFECPMPHLIPADPTVGLTKDLLLYENAIIFAGPPIGQANAASQKVAFLQAPEIVQVGESWKFIELPHAVDPDKPFVATEGGLRASLFRQQAGPAAPTAESEVALRALAEYDNANTKALVDGDKKAVAQYHIGRIPKLREVVRTLTNADEQFGYDKQVVDSLAAAYQTGFYAEGLAVLNKLAKGTEKVAPYAAFRAISAEFAAKNDEPGANVLANQKAWMAHLKAFQTEYPNSEEIPEALMQLANVNEYNAEEDEAKSYYNQLVRDHAATEPGKKAAGALKRLDLVGKSIDLKAPGLQGEEVNLAKYRGKTVLVTFWATWADPVRRDLPELIKVYNKFHSKGFEIVGIDLDTERSDLDAFLKESPIPWPQTFEAGGIEKNRLAVEYGIIALPTMILVDPQGNVTNRNIRSAAELERQLETVFKGPQTPVALDR